MTVWGRRGNFEVTLQDPREQTNAIPELGKTCFRKIPRFHKHFYYEKNTKQYKKYSQVVKKIKLFLVRKAQYIFYCKRTDSMAFVHFQEQELNLRTSCSRSSSELKMSKLYPYSPTWAEQKLQSSRSCRLSCYRTSVIYSDIAYFSCLHFVPVIIKAWQ